MIIKYRGKYMDIKSEFINFIRPMIKNEKIRQMDKYIQHGNTSCFEHCVAVAYISFYIAKKMHISCDYNSMIRGALLHDYFLYDWHEKDTRPKLHGFRHARTALENASRDFDLTPIEIDIIEKHMFPLNLKLPKYRESYIVNIADKISSSYETIYKIPCFSI